MSDTAINWREVLNQRMLVCVFTGFVSGLPLYLLIQLLPGWLRTEEVGLKEIGLFSLVGMPYAWKFLWAPLLDRYAISAFGHRRGWILLFSAALLPAIAMFAGLDPRQDLRDIVWLAVLVAFLSASLDTVIDAYRRELLHDNELGLGNTIHVQAYRISSLIPGSLAFIVADTAGWSAAFYVVAGVMLLGVGLSLMSPEPSRVVVRPRSLREAVVEPFREFISRAGVKHALLVIAFMFLYKIGDNMAVALSSAFYIDLGFSLTEIGLVAKHAALWPAIAGGVIGGVLMLKWGINKSLWVFGGVQWMTIFGFAILAQVGHSKIMLAAAISAEYLGVGLGTAAFTAYIARETSPAFAATQLALFTAFTSVPRSVASAATGFIVESTGWTTFFLICAACAIPGLLLLFKVAPLGRTTESATLNP